MAEELHIDSSLDKAEQYKSLLFQIGSLLEGEKDLIANLANLVAALKYGMNFFWVGVYFVRENELVLGPFQGPVACTRIQKGKGVCGLAWEKKETLVVGDVDQFPGHISCSSLSRSEIVIPIVDQHNEVIMVLDIDSDQLHHFDATDQQYLEQLGVLINGLI